MYDQCPECGRIFDLTNDEDAGESYWGHDCEAPQYKSERREALRERERRGMKTHDKSIRIVNVRSPRG